MLCRYTMPRPDDTAFQERKGGFDCVGALSPST
jgi:hypothetical protein